MNAHVALLRGINVGGKNRLPMAALVEFFKAAGCRDVRTYIQSGNVIYTPPAKADGVAAAVARAIKARLKLDVPVVTRTVDELKQVVAANPFLRKPHDPERLHVVFLADTPTTAAVKTLEPDRSPPDAFVVRGREIYLHTPNGMGKTRLTNAWFDARLKTVSTVRNWRTVLSLLALAQGRKLAPGKRERE